MMPARRYAAVAQTTASKERILVLLLRKALSSMEIARAALVDDEKKSDEAFDRALAIVAELEATLDPRRGDRFFERRALAGSLRRGRRAGGRVVA